MNKIIIKDKKFTGWHFLGNNKKIHIIIGTPKDDIGWITLCKQHGNGISQDEIDPEKLFPKNICKTCMKLVRKTK